RARRGRRLMAVRYQKARVLIAGSMAAAVVAGTAYFAQPQPSAGTVATTPAGTPSQTIQNASPATTVKQPALAPAKAKKSRGS
ncbi:MAG: hypothetical protein ABI577_02790, partial [bacterium]